MSEKLYSTDSYVKEFEATVVAANGKEIELDRTAFYPGGGGQLCDIGIISANSNRLNVVETKKGEGGAVIHVLDTEASLPVGTKVHGEIEWKRRYGLMRHHTALHVIDAIVEIRYAGKVTGSQIYPDRARMDFDIPGLDRPKAEAIMKEAQEAINKKLKITVKILSMDEANKIPNLVRTEPGRELMKKLTEARVVDIEGLDVQLDGGTHVANTEEIGTIELIGYESRGAHNKRVEIRLV